MPGATRVVQRHPPFRVWPGRLTGSYRLDEMRSLFRTLASALSIALLLPALASSLSPCGMPDCPMVECGAPAEQAGHDCCPAADTSLTAPCCEQRVEAPATPTRVAEKPAAPALASVDAPDPGGSLEAEISWPAKARPSRALDCLSQSCVLRI